ncbi:serine/threonine-protein kinase [Streptomyces sp. URMC 123]|uniref:serine/threonine-protein kinase n=1 Tax=Streptomyces sp. URMC 123 TaxID=3423403 RepID=UPI003F1A4F71
MASDRGSAVPPDSADGRLIAGRYRLGARLGRGGMGTVWRARDELLGREVAVKELHFDDGLPERDIRLRRERTLREARTVAQLKHPHVIVLHDVVEQDGRPWLVMELVDGRSLADRVSAEGPVGPREAARIGVALLSALRTAHACGVLHRDVKPANVLVESATGRVVLTDFGIAQVSGGTTITETGSFMGSPEYTAPERMSGARTGPESDLWSLGVLLCAVLSGASPFHRDSLGGVLHAVVHDEIRPPEAARPLLPVVRGLLERDPDLRLDALEAERMLRTYLTTGRTPAARTGRGPGRPRSLPCQLPLPLPYPAADPLTDPPEDLPEDLPRTARAGRRAPCPGDMAALAAAAAGGLPPVDAVPPGRAGRRRGLWGHSRRHGHGDGGRRCHGGREGRGGRRHGGWGLACWHVACWGRGGWGPGGRERAGPRAPGDPAGGARARRAFAVALLVASVGAAGAGAVALVLHGDGHGSTAGAPPGAGGRPSAAPRLPEGPTGSAVPTAPAGYRTVTDPAGFVVAVPQDFTRSFEPPRVFYLSPDENIRLGVHIRDQERGGPAAAMRAADEDGPADYEGYRDGVVSATTYKGRPAAVWEFTWDGWTPDDAPRHTIDVAWDEAGRMYDVWVSAPLADRAQARRYFDTALATFVRTRPES